MSDRAQGGARAITSTDDVPILSDDGPGATHAGAVMGRRVGKAERTITAKRVSTVPAKGTGARRVARPHATLEEPSGIRRRSSVNDLSVPRPQPVPVDLLRYLSYAPGSGDDSAPPPPSARDQAFVPKEAARKAAPSPVAQLVPQSPQQDGPWQARRPQASTASPPAPPRPASPAIVAKPAGPYGPPAALPLDRRAVPIVRVVRAILRKLDLAPNELFLLESCNGVTTVGDLIEIGVVPPDRIEAVIRRLVAANIVQLREPRSVLPPRRR